MYRPFRLGKPRFFISILLEAAVGDAKIEVKATKEQEVPEEAMGPTGLQSKAIHPRQVRALEAREAVAQEGKAYRPEAHNTVLRPPITDPEAAAAAHIIVKADPGPEPETTAQAIRA